MLPCEQVNISAETFMPLVQNTSHVCSCYNAMLQCYVSEGRPQWQKMAAGIGCEYKAAHLTYFRLPSIAKPPSFVNLIANFVQSWTWSLFPFSARPVS